MVGLILYLRGFRLLRSLTRSHRTGSAPIPSALDPTQESDVRFWRQFKLRHESRAEIRTGRDKGTRLAAVSSEVCEYDPPRGGYRITWLVEGRWGEPRDFSSAATPNHCR